MISKRLFHLGPPLLIGLRLGLTPRLQHKRGRVFLQLPQRLFFQLEPLLRFLQLERGPLLHACQLLPGF